MSGQEIPDRETISAEGIADRLNRGVETIKAGLRKGNFPFGRAYQTDNGQWVYICSRKAFDRWMEQGDTVVVNYVMIHQDDFDTLAKVIVAR